uniref:Uncharacterized protein n=1 Tax=Erpetoichthys calabaricus TaxID=27687 RepID=A0A8C4X788_ERPCA
MSLEGNRSTLWKHTRKTCKLQAGNTRDRARHTHTGSSRVRAHTHTGSVRERLTHTHRQRERERDTDVHTHRQRERESWTHKVGRQLKNALGLILFSLLFTAIGS